MLGGIVFQLIAIVVYMTLGAHFYYRYKSDKPVRKDENATPRGELTGRLHVLVVALALSTAFLFVRYASLLMLMLCFAHCDGVVLYSAIYRTVELSDGWRGKVMATQWLFNFFDAAMVLLAVYSVLIAHPGWLLQSRHKASDVAGMERHTWSGFTKEGKHSRTSSYETGMTA
jgi:hypothetical protein